jgi:hypothetical protein
MFGLAISISTMIDSVRRCILFPVVGAISNSN